MGGYVNLTCSCGHSDDFDNFTRTPLYGDLKPGEFQCPACGSAWKRQEGGHKILRAGKAEMIIATKVSVVLIGGRL